MGTPEPTRHPKPRGDVVLGMGWGWWVREKKRG